MANAILTKLQATTNDKPQMTFSWSFNETREALKVVCNYGGGTDTSNVATALIPWNSSSSVSMQAADNPDITVTGSVSAVWYNDGYAVFFAGNMNYPNVNDIVANPGLVGYSPYGIAAEAAMKKK